MLWNRSKATFTPTSISATWFTVAWSLAASVSACDDSASRAISSSAHETRSEITVEVTGHEFEWTFRYPGLDGVLLSDDDVVAMRDLHLPVNHPTKLSLRSLDYLYTLTLPRWGVAEIAVPDLEFSLSFLPKSVGQYELLGDQMCGYQHEDLIGTVVVESEEEFEDWLSTLDSESLRSTATTLAETQAPSSPK